ncbi:hypothetical protein LPTSP4_34340 [Leptospira ryugenii]|uniref:Uncharacterized protein n=1 Tax=Leptospira ryugenii TaxID=1917863 RepID=A0A2P2E4V8_9LEPT|nr:VanZ family protein [Leptospira ryugenii]GBF51896.1 hypothetical protein LPTSP4_34340 [Leptospira ryugenii]
MEKRPFPFSPFVDSLLGEKILIIAKKHGLSEDFLLSSLKKNLSLPEFYFTPNSQKQTLMVRYPNLIRKLIESGDFNGLVDIFLKISKGQTQEFEIPAIDLSFELIEWLLTGFEMKNQIADILNALFGVSEFQESWIEEIWIEYQKEL